MPVSTYKTTAKDFLNAGLVARYSIDQVPENTYINLDNCESRQERSISTCFGSVVVNQNGTTNLPLVSGTTKVHTLARLKGLTSTFRYAGASTFLFIRQTDSAGAFTQLATGLSGQRFSTGVYRPDASSQPWLFIADKSILLKHNGLNGSASNWGFPQPNVPMTMQLAAPVSISVEQFSAALATYSPVNLTGGANPLRVTTTVNQSVTGGSVSTVTPASMLGIVQGVVLQVGGGSPETITVIQVNTDANGNAVSFNAFFVNNHVAADTLQDTTLLANVAANTTGSIQKAIAINLGTINGLPVDNNDVINLWMNMSAPGNLTEVRLLFDVGDGSFTQDYYMKTVSPASFQDVVSGVATGEAGATRRVFGAAGGNVDFRIMGEVQTDILTGNDPSTPRIRPGRFNAGLFNWTLLQFRTSEFLPVGGAGSLGKTWSNVKGWKISVQSNTNGPIAVSFDDLFLSGGNGLDSFAGQPYDYRFTFYNSNTGYETNPSITIIATNALNARRQPITVGWYIPTDTQFTHARIYRRGGTLTIGWFLVATVPIANLTYTDGAADSTILINKLLEIDNDPPVTSLLPAPVNTSLLFGVPAVGVQSVAIASFANISTNQTLTVGVGATQEQVMVIGVDRSQNKITAYFQYTHNAGEFITASTQTALPMNLTAIAFDRAWLAGDPNNPHFLYYSKVQRPESFPAANFIEIGTPKDPIMAVVELKGLLFVWTLTRVYEVLAPAGQVPVAIPTGSKHGLISPFAYAIAENVVYFLGIDGVYVFRGGKSDYLVEPTQWVWTDQALGPVIPADPTKTSDTVMAYGNHEVFVAFTGTDQLRHRQIWSDIYSRWRPDTKNAWSILYEEDTGNFIFGDNAGLVHQDRVGDYDSGGFSGGIEIVNPIAFNIQTGSMEMGEKKAKKIFNEFTLDFDSQGQNIDVTLLFDRGTTPVDLGTFNSTGRSSVQRNVTPTAPGVGQNSYDVAIKITGSVTQAVIFYQWAIRAVVEAELRQSSDSYWTDFGTPDFKFIKEFWFEYVSFDSAGITISLYAEGNVTTPFYSFVLPQALVRTARRVRIPAKKGKVFRYIGVSASDYRMYDNSFVYYKPVGSKGYAKAQVVS